MRRRTRTYMAAVVTLGALALVQACTENQPTSPFQKDSFAAAPGGGRGGGGGSGGPSVNAADPAWGNKNETGKQVHLLGSGFEPGSEVVWQRNGIATADVSVTNVTFVSESELIATIDISGGAELAFYDVAVTRLSDRKTGIGTEKFEVTLAMSIGTLDYNTLARGVNENREVVGYSVVKPETHAFYWSDSDGMLDLGVGGAWGIDEAGHTISGRLNGVAVIWSRNGAGWIPQPLPTSQNEGLAEHLASDPITGEALYIAGYELVGAQKKNKTPQPLLWSKVSGAWTRMAMAVPAGGSGAGSVRDVNAAGQAVGQTDGRPTVWENPASATLLPGTASAANAISSDGNMVVGFDQSSLNNPFAVYWTRQPGGWSGPHALPECGWAMDVDDEGNILATKCSDSGVAVWAPPYTTPYFLGRLGVKNESAHAEALTHNGLWAVGSAAEGGLGSVGVLWTVR